jgi:hypothetical protein
LHNLLFFGLVLGHTLDIGGPVDPQTHMEDGAVVQLLAGGRRVLRVVIVGDEELRVQIGVRTAKVAGPESTDYTRTGRLKVRKRSQRGQDLADFVDCDSLTRGEGFNEDSTFRTNPDGRWTILQNLTCAQDEKAGVCVECRHRPSEE